jgi:4'-phosphopantetheinyl transferase
VLLTWDGSLSVPFFPLNLRVLCLVAHSMNISDPAFQLETQITLPAEEVHLWHVDLASVAKGEQRWEQILSEDERARATRFHFSRDRQYFTATRALLRTILGGYLDSDPKALRFQYSKNEKPSLTPSQSQNPVEFNVSHSGDVALLAFARGRDVGVDVEQLRENFDHEAVARRFFSEQEQRQLAALAPADRYHGFFRCWTRKEAYIKARGTGLAFPLHQFDVSLRPGEENALISTRPDSTEAARWSLQDVRTGKAYVAALCVLGLGWRLKS